MTMSEDTESEPTASFWHNIPPAGSDFTVDDLRKMFEECAKDGPRNQDLGAYVCPDCGSEMLIVFPIPMTFARKCACGKIVTVDVMLKENE